MADREGIVGIYMALRSNIGRAVLGIVPPKEVEDIVQETYVRVCQIKSTEQIKDPQSFVFRTARNLALDYVRRSENRLSNSYDEVSEYSLPQSSVVADATFDEVANNEEFAHFCEAVRHLPVKCRRAFVLKKVYGYSQREIAKEMEISESTVEKHIARGITSCTYYVMRHGEGSNKVGELDRNHASRSNAGSAGKDYT